MKPSLQTVAVAAMAGIFVFGGSRVWLRAQATTFSSGSTGADGALVVPPNIPTFYVSVPVPDSGVLNYTTVTINGNVFFPHNRLNTPLVILAQGDVQIGAQGLVDVSNGGPGSFPPGGPGQTGSGPGGGAFVGSTADPSVGAGHWIGPLSLVPIIGGSGGGGTLANPGGNAGGAIVIASSTQIHCDGGIAANGIQQFDSGPGSGGAIRLVANSFSGACALNAAAGAFSGQTPNPSNAGVIRIEASAVNFTGTSTPQAVLAPINPEVLPPATAPALAITSIGGVSINPTAGAQSGTVDAVLPLAMRDPIPVVVQANRIPVGTQVMLNVGAAPFPFPTYTGGTLSGTFDQSTTTLSVTGIDRTPGVNVTLYVFATFDVLQGGGTSNPPGPNQVAQLRLQTAPGGTPTMTFLRRDGTEVDRAHVSPGLLAYYGQSVR